MLLLALAETGWVPHWPQWCLTSNLLWAGHDELALRIWGFWDSCPKGLVVQQGRMGISNEVQAGLAATVLQVLGSAPRDAGSCLPAAQPAARPAVLASPCHEVMPWFSLKLFILSPLLCLFYPVVMILHGLWEREELPVHQTKSGFCWTCNQQFGVGHFGPSCKGLMKHLTGLLGLFSFCPGTIREESTGFSLDFLLTRNRPH